MFLKLMENLTYVNMFIDSACIIIFLWHTFILLLWIVVLFKNSTRLKKKLNCSTRAIHNQDSYLEALNNKVDYRKTLFMFAIVVCELISSLFTIEKTVGTLVQISIRSWRHSNSTDLPKLNNSSVSATNNYKCNISHIGWWDYQVFSNVESVCFGITLILTFSFVYTLMSYYAMVIQRSISYNTSLESVNLSRKQKIHMRAAFVMCLIMLVLLVRIEVYVLFQIVESLVAIIQFILTNHYSNKLVQVFRWKLKDTEIAFGTDNYQYKLYSKALRTYKRFAFVYKLVVFFFCIHVSFRSVTIFTTNFGWHNIHAFYGVCINPHQYANLFKILGYIARIMRQVERIPIAISFILLFILNLSTVPFLLSKVNLSCCISSKSLNSITDKSTRRPLLS